ncbi:MAG: nucleotidyltransferase domain-containing protein, partial [Bacillota bacterium]|nr:nucleotidyltransferase domain-containing protein [Bacillota bacterium]
MDLLIQKSNKKDRDFMTIDMLNKIIIKLNSKKLVFKDLYNFGGKYYRIFPYFQKSIYEWLIQIDKTNIKEIWIFGSTLTLDATIDSDIDICIISN